MVAVQLQRVAILVAHWPKLPSPPPRIADRATRNNSCMCSVAVDSVVSRVPIVQLSRQLNYRRPIAFVACLSSAAASPGRISAVECSYVAGLPSLKQHRARCSIGFDATTPDYENRLCNAILSRFRDGGRFKLPERTRERNASENLFYRALWSILSLAILRLSSHDTLSRKMQIWIEIHLEFLST